MQLLTNVQLEVPYVTNVTERGIMDLNVYLRPEQQQLKRWKQTQRKPSWAQLLQTEELPGQLKFFYKGKNLIQDGYCGRGHSDLGRDLSYPGANKIGETIQSLVYMDRLAGTWRCWVSLQGV